MKKLINAVDDVVNESLAGFCAAHSDIVCLGETAPVVLRRHLKQGKVAPHRKTTLSVFSSRSRVEEKPP